MSRKPTTLRGYFELIRKPRAGQRLNKKSAKCYLTAINRFGRHLGRVPQLADLNAASWDALGTWFAHESGYTVPSYRDSLTRLRRLWRSAHKAGLAEPPHTKRQARFIPAWEAPVPAAGSLREFFLTYYLPLRLRGRSDRTRTLYLSSIRAFGRHLGRDPMLDDLNDVTVSAHLTALAGRGLTPNSIEKERCQLLAMWRAACRKNLVREWPEVLAETLPRRVPRAWNQDDLAKLFAAIEVQVGEFCGIPKAAYWRALHHVLYWSAERIGAIRQLRWTDYDATSGWLVFPAETRKGRHADNLVKLPPVAIAALEAIREPERALIFPWDLSPCAIYDHYRKVLVTAGLPIGPKSMFHAIRRTAASYFEAAGGNATELLMHTSRKVTMAYLDPRIVKRTQAADLLPSPVEPSA